MKRYSFSEIFEYPKEPEEIFLGYKTADIFISHTIHSHEFYEMTYLSSGTELQIINGKSYYLKRGDLIILSPNDTHEHTPLSKTNPFQCSFINNSHLSFFPQISSFPIVVHLDEKSQIYIEQILYLMSEEYNNNFLYRNLALWHYLDSIFLIIQRNMQNPKLKKWKKTIEYVLNNPKEAEFSKAVSISGYSSSHFCRMFKQEFSMTFTEFLINIRIGNAKKLLENSTESIKEIYEKCGYISNQCFFHDFKKLVGLTPMQYRKHVNSINLKKSNKS